MSTSYPKAWAPLLKTAVPQQWLSEYGDLRVLRKADVDDGEERELIVAGYASPQVVDRQKHLITREAMAKDLPRFLAHPHYRNAMVTHTNIQVAEVLPEWTDPMTGQKWTTHVDELGLFAVVKVRTDAARPAICKKVEQDILSGKLRSFSISGDAPFESRQHICENGTCFWLIQEIEFYEFTICESPVNQDAHFAVISKADAMALSAFCQDGVCSLLNVPAATLDKSVRPIVKGLLSKLEGDTGAPAGSSNGLGKLGALGAPKNNIGMKKLNMPPNVAALAGRSTADPRGGGGVSGARAGGNAMSMKSMTLSKDASREIIRYAQRHGADPSEFTRGLGQEAQEHGRDIGGDMSLIASVVLGHLREDPRYYSRSGMKQDRVLRNARVYIDSPADAPEGVRVEQGKRPGTWFYESSEEQNVFPDDKEEPDEGEEAPDEEPLEVLKPADTSVGDERIVDPPPAGVEDVLHNSAGPLQGGGGGPLQWSGQFEGKSKPTQIILPDNPAWLKKGTPDEEARALAEGKHPMEGAIPKDKRVAPDTSHRGLQRSLGNRVNIRTAKERRDSRAKEVHGIKDRFSPSTDPEGFDFSDRMRGQESLRPWTSESHEMANDAHVLTSHSDQALETQARESLDELDRLADNFEKEKAAGASPEELQRMQGYRNWAFGRLRQIQGEIERRGQKPLNKGTPEEDAKALAEGKHPMEGAIPKQFQAEGEEGLGRHVVRRNRGAGLRDLEFDTKRRSGPQFVNTWNMKQDRLNRLAGKPREELPQQEQRYREAGDRDYGYRLRGNEPDRRFTSESHLIADKAKGLSELTDERLMQLTKISADVLDASQQRYDKFKEVGDHQGAARMLGELTDNFSALKRYQGERERRGRNGLDPMKEGFKKSTTTERKPSRSGLIHMIKHRDGRRVGIYQTGPAGVEGKKGARGRPSSTVVICEDHGSQKNTTRERMRHDAHHPEEWCQHCTVLNKTTPDEEAAALAEGQHPMQGAIPKEFRVQGEKGPTRKVGAQGGYGGYVATRRTGPQQGTWDVDKKRFKEVHGDELDSEPRTPGNDPKWDYQSRNRFNGTNRRFTNQSYSVANYAERLAQASEHDLDTWMRVATANLDAAQEKYDKLKEAGDTAGAQNKYGSLNEHYGELKAIKDELLRRQMMNKAFWNKKDKGPDWANMPNLEVDKIVSDPTHPHHEAARREATGRVSGQRLGAGHTKNKRGQVKKAGTTTPAGTGQGAWAGGSQMVNHGPFEDMPPTNGDGNQGNWGRSSEPVDIKEPRDEDKFEGFAEGQREPGIGKAMTGKLSKKMTVVNGGVTERPDYERNITSPFQKAEETSAEAAVTKDPKTELTVSDPFKKAETGDSADNWLKSNQEDRRENEGKPHAVRDLGYPGRVLPHLPPSSVWGCTCGMKFVGEQNARRHEEESANTPIHFLSTDEVLDLPIDDEDLEKALPPLDRIDQRAGVSPSAPEVDHDSEEMYLNKNVTNSQSIQRISRSSDDPTRSGLDRSDNRGRRYGSKVSKEPSRLSKLLHSSGQLGRGDNLNSPSIRRGGGSSSAPSNDEQDNVDLAIDQSRRNRGLSRSSNSLDDGEGREVTGDSSVTLTLEENVLQQGGVEHHDDMHGDGDSETMLTTTSHEDTDEDIGKAFPWSDLRNALHDVLADGVKLSYDTQMQARHVLALLDTTPIHKAIGWVPFEKGNWVAWGDAGSNYGYIVPEEHIPLVPLMNSIAKASEGTSHYNESLLASQAMMRVKRANDDGLWTEVEDQLAKLWGSSVDLDEAVAPMLDFMGKVSKARMKKGYGIGWLGSARRSIGYALKNISKLEQSKDSLPPHALIALDTLKDDLEALKASIGYEHELEKELVVNDEPQLDIIESITKDRPEAGNTVQEVAEADELKAAAASSSQRGIDQEVHLKENQVRTSEDGLEALSKGDHEGMLMLCWYPTMKLASKLALADGEDPDAIHLTLAVFKNAGSIDVDKMREILDPIVGETPALDGSISGLGRFSGSSSSDGKDVFYAGADVPGLAELRTKMVDALKAHGIKPEEDHGFTPHMTLKYLGIDDPNPSERMETQPMKIESLHIVSDDNPLAELKLGGSEVAKTEDYSGKSDEDYRNGIGNDVPRTDACPNCGERDMDKIVLDSRMPEGGPQTDMPAKCSSCGHAWTQGLDSAPWVENAPPIKKATMPGAQLIDTSLQGTHPDAQISRPLRSEADKLKEMTGEQDGTVNKFESASTGLEKPVHIVGGAIGYPDEDEGNVQVAQRPDELHDNRGSAPAGAQLHRAMLGVSERDAATYFQLWKTMWKQAMPGGPDLMMRIKNADGTFEDIE